VGPRVTYCLATSRLKAVTSSGTVRARATSTGIPTSLMESSGSGLITVRAEKFTRLPDRLERNRPSFPLSRWTRVFSGRPERCRAGGIPLVWLSK